MQILGKRSKVLLIAVTIVMLVAIGISFAAWDSMSAVKAMSGNSSTYANAKVGDIIEFGNYYQTGNRINNDANAEYEKTPIEWIVVDKDERTGQLTLMSKYILASGSYFGNFYKNSANEWGAHYDNNTTVGGAQYNQAYVESTVRAYLNNLEVLNLGGDSFVSGIGYVPSAKNSSLSTGLLSSIGFSNKGYWTGLSYATPQDKVLVDLGNKGLMKKGDTDEIYYQRPIHNIEYLNRPATLGFYDEAFSNNEKQMIVPKVISGYTGFRWPDYTHDMSTKSYIEGVVDKVWLPSATELNISNGKDLSGLIDDTWTNPSDASSSTAFEYFANFSDDALANALKAKRTTFALNSFAMNYSIPIYNKGTNTVNTNIHATYNSSDHYWTRSPVANYFSSTCRVNELGLFGEINTDYSHIGVRPCVIVKY